MTKQVALNPPVPIAPLGRKTRISADWCWPLRGADGRTFAERRELEKENSK